MRRYYFLSIGAVLFVALLSVLLWTGGKVWSNRPVTTKAEPSDPLTTLMQLSLPDIQGVSHSLAAWKGQPVVVNFWATWCAPCVREMPALDTLHKKYPHIRFVGIGIDSAVNIQKFIEKIQVSYPLLVYGVEGIGLMRALGNTAGGLPFTLILDADGRSTLKILGEIQVEHLDRVLAAIK